MFFMYVSTEVSGFEQLEKELNFIDHNKKLVAVSNGYDLIQFLQNVKKGDSYPDLIILSTKMSRLKAREVLELLKSDDIYCLIPIVIFLSELEGEDDDFCRRLGAETMLTPAGNNEWQNAAKKMCTLCD